MILPIPVPPGSPEDAVRFVDMSSCAKFFDHLEVLFPQPLPPQGYAVPGFAPAPAAPTLVVHDVGDFEASFVPCVRDFARLDSRFQLPSTVWDALPAYADWGFCVFKLKRQAAPRTVHPMAFDFPRRDPRALFFPTLHVHDGSVHPTAWFDHLLYCQTGVPTTDVPEGWERSVGGAESLPPHARPFVQPSAWFYRRMIAGHQPNRDTYVA